MIGQPNTTTKRSVKRITKKPSGTITLFAIWRDDELIGTQFEESFAWCSAGRRDDGHRVVTRHEVTLKQASGAVCLDLADGERILTDSRKGGGDADVTPKQALADLRAKMRPGRRIETVDRWPGFQTHYLFGKNGTVITAVAVYDDQGVHLPCLRVEAKAWWRTDCE